MRKSGKATKHRRRRIERGGRMCGMAACRRRGISRLWLLVTCCGAPLKLEVSRSWRTVRIQVLAAQEMNEGEE